MFNMPGVQPARTQVEVDRRIEVWHDMPEEEFESLGQPSLNAYLGWSTEDYWHWVMTSEIPKE